MEKLSVAIITYNEEKNIKRCLESVVDIADEIVVLDSFSSDATESICKPYNVKFFQHAFDGHIQQKNRVLTLVSFDLVLSLDADECLDNTLKTEIKKIKENRLFDGFEMNRLTNYCGKWVRHCGWYPDKKLRLWDKTKGKWGGINPHDKYELLENSKIGYLKGDILHYSYYSIKGHLNQVNSFTEIGAQQLIIKGKKPNYFKIIFSPLVKFIRDFFIKLGFLDGFYGFVICIISSHATFLKYVKHKQMWDEKNNNK